MDRELIEFLSDKFDKVDNRFDKNDNRLDKIDTRLNGVGLELTNIKEDLKEAKEERKALMLKIDEVYTSVDGFIKIVDRLEQEFIVIKEDLRRVKDVIKEKLGVDIT